MPEADPETATRRQIARLLDDEDRTIPMVAGRVCALGPSHHDSVQALVATINRAKYGDAPRGQP